MANISPTEGWAIRRNGTCVNGLEVDCGQTLAPFHGCCPTGLQCPRAFNLACCNPGQNCTESLLAAPQPVCANATWDLFDNGGFFCCESGYRAYNRRSTNVCAKPGVSVSAGDIPLTLIRSGIDPATVLPSSSSIASNSASTTSVTLITDPASTSPPAQESSGSSTPVGAIAGGVVGGVVAIVLLSLLAWFLLRRKRRENPYKPALELHSEPNHELAHDGNVKYMHQVNGQYVHEADGVMRTTDGRAAELPAQQYPIELPANSKPVQS